MKSDGNGKILRLKDKTAFIFDLFGTLVPIPTRTEYAQLCKEMAKTLRVPYHDFMLWWDPDRAARMTGYLSVEGNLRKIVQHHLGQKRSGEVYAKAMKIYFQYHARWLLPKKDAVATLKWIRHKGFRTALVSNCSSAVSSLWPRQTLAKYFDAAVLSCQVGLAKPDPKIYALVCKKLQVKPQQCVYVGDGGDGELTAASDCGMTPIRVKHHTDDGLVFHCDAMAVHEVEALSALTQMISTS